MPHSFEQDRESHRIHHMHIPQGHAHMDEKTQKMGRSPMSGQLPMANGLENPTTDGAPTGEGTLGGGSGY